MKRVIDLSKLTTPQLLEVRKILAGGVESTASKAGDTARKELAELKREKEIREIVSSYGLDFDDDPEYWKQLDSQGALEFVCKKIAHAMKVANAEKPAIMRIPQVVGTVELSTFDTVQQGFKELKDKGMKIVQMSSEDSKKLDKIFFDSTWAWYAKHAPNTAPKLRVVLAPYLPK